MSIARRVLRLYGSTYEAAKFLDRPNNALDGLSPYQAIAESRFGAVEKLITWMEQERRQMQ
jgi:uncharacterized protein (DUF2384 family)